MTLIKHLLVKHKKILNIFLVILVLTILSLISYQIKIILENKDLQIKSLTKEKKEEITKLLSIEKKYNDLKDQDQYKINIKLQEDIKNIHDVYSKSISIYEKLQDLKVISKKTTGFDELYAKSVNELSEKNFNSASATLDELSKKIQDEKEKTIALSVTIKQDAPINNTPPSSGFSQQRVQTDVGTFTVSIISADLNTTRVIVDTASDSDCGNDCPVLSLADYVTRNGAFAGINGTYFCPSTYPSCVGKTNSFDLLVMNKNKKYFNSDNNVYSTNPAVIFKDNWARFVTKTQEWGRDTGVDAVISNFPLLLLDNNIVYGGDGDPKHASRGGRSFIAASGSTVYIGVVFNATLMESAKVLKALNVGNALNLDNGGSTALWSGGYKAGPGRNLPNVVLLVKK